MFNPPYPMVPQLELPNAERGPQINENTTIVDFKFHGSGPPPKKSTIERLTELRFTLQGAADAEQVAACDELIVLHYATEEKIKTFINANKERKVAVLTARRNGLWEQARQLEDEIEKLLQSVWNYRNLTVSGERRISAAQVEVNNQAARPFRTKFPRQVELDEWASRKSVAHAALAAAEGEKSEARGLLHSAEAEHQAAVEKLRGIEEEIRVIDQQIVAGD